MHHWNFTDAPNSCHIEALQERSRLRFLCWLAPENVTNQSCSQIWVAHGMKLSRKGLFSCSRNENKSFSYKTQTVGKSPVLFRGELWGKQNSVKNNRHEPEGREISMMHLTPVTYKCYRNVQGCVSCAPENLTNHSCSQLWVAQGMKMSRKGLFSCSRNDNKHVGHKTQTVRKSPVQFRGELWGKQNSVKNNHHEPEGHEISLMCLTPLT